LAGDRAVLDAQLAFGYARAIPTNYGDLPARSLPKPLPLDRRLALLAVGDGDAMLSVLLRANLASNAAKAQNAARRRRRRLDRRPGRGRSIAADLSRLTLDVGEGLRRAFTKPAARRRWTRRSNVPPRSTEQLLHPERYASGEMPLTLQPLAPDLGKDWSLTLEDTLGEAFLELALLEWRGGKAADASDWGGDLLQVWGGPGGRDVVSVANRWIRPKRRRASTLKSWKRCRKPSSTGPVYTRVLPDSLPAGQWWDGRLGAIYLRRTASDVILVWAATRRQWRRSARCWGWAWTSGHKNQRISE
jgi:hypothetical protein